MGALSLEDLTKKGEYHVLLYSVSLEGVAVKISQCGIGVIWSGVGTALSPDQH